MQRKAIKNLITTIQQMRSNDVFKKYIEYIRFPFFRNLKLDSKLNLEFPVTALVGRNGGGKSSTLQALFGCPEGKSLGNYWFSTELDPIVDPDTKNRHCFIYAYKDVDGDKKEVLKTRIKKADDPDYWEPSRPIAKYGMKKPKEGTRNKNIDMNVVYIDFKAILSAFDKYFYFHEPRTRSKQSYLRDKAKTLKRVLSADVIVTKNGKALNKKPVWLSEKEIENLSTIMGKKYLKIGLVEHSFYGSKGTSIVLKTQNQEYSEAFAGSGETAAAILVNELWNIPEHSLVLLDEPEVSLHPGAQKQLIKFILEQAIKKKLQVVISTHSPSIVELLPTEAIKVFQEAEGGRVEIVPNVSASEAFFSLGHEVTDKINVIVEDELARLLISGVLSEQGDAFSSLFSVSYLPGGASNIHRNISSYSMETNIRRYVMFDGDQRPAEICDPDRVPTADLTETFLKEKIELQAKQEIKFYPDGGQSSSAESTILLMKSYLKFYFNNVGFIPDSTPENLLWDDGIALKLFEAFSVEESLQKKILGYDSKKDRFQHLASSIASSGGSDIRAFQKGFLNAWLKKRDDNYQALQKKLVEIRDKFIQT